MELTPEYIKAVRFTVKRGNTYDAAEVDEIGRAHV